MNHKVLNSFHLLCNWNPTCIFMLSNWRYCIWRWFWRTRNKRCFEWVHYWAKHWDYFWQFFFISLYYLCVHLYMKDSWGPSGYLLYFPRLHTFLLFLVHVTWTDRFYFCKRPSSFLALDLMVDRCTRLCWRSWRALKKGFIQFFHKNQNRFMSECTGSVCFFFSCVCTCLMKTPATTHPQNTHSDTKVHPSVTHLINTKLGLSAWGLSWNLC